MCHNIIRAAIIDEVNCAPVKEQTVCDLGLEDVFSEALIIRTDIIKITFSEFPNRGTSN